MFKFLLSSFLSDNWVRFLVLSFYLLAFLRFTIFYNFSSGFAFVVPKGQEGALEKGSSRSKDRAPARTSKEVLEELDPLFPGLKGRGSSESRPLEEKGSTRSGSEGAYSLPDTGASISSPTKDGAPVVEGDTPSVEPQVPSGAERAGSGPKTLGDLIGEIVERLITMGLREFDPFTDTDHLDQFPVGDRAPVDEDLGPRPIPEVSYPEGARELDSIEGNVRIGSSRELEPQSAPIEGEEKGSPKPLDGPKSGQSHSSKDKPGFGPKISKFIIIAVPFNLGTGREPSPSGPLPSASGRDQPGLESPLYVEIPNPIIEAPLGEQSGEGLLVAAPHFYPGYDAAANNAAANDAVLNSLYDSGVRQHWATDVLLPGDRSRGNGQRVTPGSGTNIETPIGNFRDYSAYSVSSQSEAPIAPPTRHGSELRSHARALDNLFYGSGGGTEGSEPVSFGPTIPAPRQSIPSPVPQLRPESAGQDSPALNMNARGVDIVERHVPGRYGPNWVSNMDGLGNPVGGEPLELAAHGSEAGLPPSDSFSTLTLLEGPGEDTVCNQVLQGGPSDPQLCPGGLAQDLAGCPHIDFRSLEGTV